jgi:lipopolysaccharide transport system ATP-binding protein
MQMGRPSIRVENLAKRYQLGRATGARYQTLRESLMESLAVPWQAVRDWWNRPAPSAPNPTTDRTIWALRDVSFDVNPGEVVGVIGRNGAGKSTLLKILCRITEPTRGRIELRGRVGSLLEVGTGFHPELTGRENVYLSGVILGMSRQEVRAKFDDIVAFADVARFIDTPVKRYSSGMQVRLAFAVAAHLEPEILLVDEVLAVGDAAFQKKCLGHLQQLSRGGRTVFFVSHDIAAVSGLCTRCLLLNGGKVERDGTPRDVISTYAQSWNQAGVGVRDLRDHPGRSLRSIPLMTRVAAHHGNDPGLNSIAINDDLHVTVWYESDRPLASVDCGLVLRNAMQLPVLGVNNKVMPCDFPSEPSRRGKVQCILERLPLMPGRYSIDLYFGTMGDDLDIIHDAISFDVVPADVFGTGKLPPANTGSLCWPARWSIVSDEHAPTEQEVAS